jgi:hypothetical protein
MEVDGQKMYTSGNGQLKLKQSTKAENFIAVNNQAESRWLESNGQIFLSVLLKDFIFENQIIQSDFIDHFTESGKFPKLEFKGFIEDIQHIDLTNSGGNEISVDGNLVIHGVSQKIVFMANLTVLSSGKIMLKSELKLRWKDFNITSKSLAPETIISIYCIYE